MSKRFAKIEEEAINHHTDLTGEELRLYVLIKFHTWNDTGVCRKNLRQLSKLHKLSYTHTTERYKKLKKLKWCEDTKEGIRPLINLNVPKTGTFDDEMFQKAEHGSSENRNIGIPESGTFNDEMFQKAEHPFIPYIEPFKDEISLTAAAEEKPVAEAAAETVPHKSKFSLSECLRYAEICKLRGENIRSVEALATSAYKNGNLDAFVSATLYPEQTPLEEISDAEADKEMAEALELLRDVQAMGEDISGFEKYYAPELWARLMGEMGNVEREN
jgi:hypothetical protein